MITAGSAEEQERRAGFRRFASEAVAPFAAEADAQERLPHQVIQKIAEKGYLAPWLPEEWGGAAMDMLSYGLLNEEIGYACSAARSLLTAHGMVAWAIYRCGNAAQRKAFLPALARGDRLGAFALSEPGVGSDAKAVETLAETTAEGYRLSGCKTWITFGQITDLYLVLARCSGGPTMFLVDRDCAGVSVKPLTGMLGTRGTMLAELTFDGCRIGSDRRVGREGAGFTIVGSSALEQGRFSVAWGCVGIIRACLDVASTYTAERRQFGTELRNHQLVRALISDMLTSLHAADLLCRRAADLRQAGDPDAFMETMIAKYYASTAAKRVADDAVQVLGAKGCSDQYPVARMARDAKIMEIIEGSTQMQQLSIAGHAYRQHPA